MPDHSVHGKGWPAAPLWASKYAVENYVRQVRSFSSVIMQQLDAQQEQIDLPATFIYTGIYNNK